MNTFDDLAAKIAEHERAIAELRKERRSFIPELVAGAYVPDANGNWPMLKDVAKVLGLPTTVVRRAIADQTPAPGDDGLLEVILQRRGETTYVSISRELGISPLRVRDILARHWQQEAEEWARNRPQATVESPPYDGLLQVDMITREAVRLFRNSNLFLQTIGREFDDETVDFDRHILQWQQQPDARIGAQLRIRLPNEYGHA